jgi:hypothetical protein
MTLKDEALNCKNSKPKHDYHLNHDNELNVSQDNIAAEAGERFQLFTSNKHLDATANNEGGHGGRRGSGTMKPESFLKFLTGSNSKLNIHQHRNNSPPIV